MADIRVGNLTFAVGGVSGGDAAIDDQLGITGGTHSGYQLAIGADLFFLNAPGKCDPQEVPDCVEPQKRVVIGGHAAFEKLQDTSFIFNPFVLPMVAGNTTKRAGGHIAKEYPGGDWIWGQYWHRIEGQVGASWSPTTAGTYVGAQYSFKFGGDVRGGFYIGGTGRVTGPTDFRLSSGLGLTFD